MHIIKSIVMLKLYFLHFLCFLLVLFYILPQKGRFLLLVAFHPNRMKVENDLNFEKANKPFSDALDNLNIAGRFINTSRGDEESKTELIDTQEDVLEKYFYDETKFSVCLKTYPSNLVGHFLSNKFAANNSEEVDVIVCKYVMMYIKLYPKESHTHFINEVTKRLGDLRKNYYDRACQIMSMIVNGESHVSEALQLSKPTKIVKVNDEKYIEGIRKEVKAEIEIKKPDKVEKYTQYTPRTIQECQNMMRKNKYISVSKLCLYYIPILVPKTTNRMLAISSSSLFETVINFYDDRIEDLNMMKINAIASLIAYSYANISSAIFDVVKEGSYINKTILILSMINNLHVIDEPTLIDILETFCILYVPNKLTNDIALTFVQKSAAVFDDDPKIACLCQKFTLKIKS